ncbi:MAG TPA: methyltransferase domain-containing protein [Solirubrobacteraceae bacterium]|nr:methyltransferase domain-containing protein [Solirubrobacteraceae bacterium]
MPETRTWDGKSYDRISGPMEALGLEVLSRLELKGDELVLDAGCGSGRITQALIERVPEGHVVAADASASMVAAARERLPGADVRQVDLLDLDLEALGLERPFDAILSTATFHWILDHERLFARLHGALRPGGRLLAQCGGAGNIDVLRGHANDVLAREPYAAAFAGFRSPWNYATPQDTRERLIAAGFEQADCWLQPAPKQPEEPREFLTSIVLGPHYQHLPEELREPFMDDVLAELGEPVVVDYVRLNIDATA